MVILWSNLLFIFGLLFKSFLFTIKKMLGVFLLVRFKSFNLFSPCLARWKPKYFNSLNVIQGPIFLC